MFAESSHTTDLHSSGIPGVPRAGVKLVKVNGFAKSLIYGDVGESYSERRAFYKKNFKRVIEYLELVLPQRRQLVRRALKRASPADD